MRVFVMTRITTVTALGFALIESVGFDHQTLAFQAVIVALLSKAISDIAADLS